MEHYGPNGRLLRVVQRNGWTNTLTYSDAATPASIAPRPGLLISVRNHFGRELRFTYDAAGRLAELLPPGAVSGTAPGSAASPIRYVHNEPAGLGSGVPALNQPTSVVWQDGALRRYHYENTQFPQWLTGRTDELGVRIGTYSYDTYGLLARSAGPSGMNVVDLIYRGSTTEVTDRSGATPTTSVYTWETAAGVIRPTAISAPCTQCGSTSARSVLHRHRRSGAARGPRRAHHFLHLRHQGPRDRAGDVCGQLQQRHGAAGAQPGRAGGEHQVACDVEPAHADCGAGESDGVHVWDGREADGGELGGNDRCRGRCSTSGRWLRSDGSGDTDARRSSPSRRNSIVLPGH